MQETKNKKENKCGSGGESGERECKNKKRRYYNKNCRNKNALQLK